MLGVLDDDRDSDSGDDADFEDQQDPFGAATAIYGEESKNPTRTVPVSTYIAVILIGMFYAFSSWAIVLAFGPDQVQAAAQADTAGLTFAAAAQCLGPWSAGVMEVLLLTSLFAVAGADPVLQLFSWMSGMATISILLVMVLTSRAIIAFFARHRSTGAPGTPASHPWSARSD